MYHNKPYRPRSSFPWASDKRLLLSMVIAASLVGFLIVAYQLLSGPGSRKGGQLSEDAFEGQGEETKRHLTGGLQLADEEDKLGGFNSMANQNRQSGSSRLPGFQKDNEELLEEEEANSNGLKSKPAQANRWESADEQEDQQVEDSDGGNEQSEDADQVQNAQENGLNKANNEEELEADGTDEGEEKQADDADGKVDAVPANNTHTKKDQNSDKASEANDEQEEDNADQATEEQVNDTDQANAEQVDNADQTNDEQVNDADQASNEQAVRNNIRKNQQADNTNEPDEDKENPDGQKDQAIDDNNLLNNNLHVDNTDKANDSNTKEADDQQDETDDAQDEAAGNAKSGGHKQQTGKSSLAQVSGQNETNLVESFMSSNNNTAMKKGEDFSKQKSSVSANSTRLKVTAEGASDADQLDDPTLTTNTSRLSGDAGNNFTKINNREPELPEPDVVELGANLTSDQDVSSKSDMNSLAANQTHHAHEAETVETTNMSASMTEASENTPDADANDLLANVTKHGTTSAKRNISSTTNVSKDFDNKFDHMQKHNTVQVDEVQYASSIDMTKDQLINSKLQEHLRNASNEVQHEDSSGVSTKTRPNDLIHLVPINGTNGKQQDVHQSVNVPFGVVKNSNLTEDTGNPLSASKTTDGRTSGVAEDQTISPVNAVAHDAISSNAEHEQIDEAGSQLKKLSNERNAGSQSGNMAAIAGKSQIESAAQRKDQGRVSIAKKIASEATAQVSSQLSQSGSSQIKTGSSSSPDYTQSNGKSMSGSADKQGSADYNEDSPNESEQNDPLQSSSNVDDEAEQAADKDEETEQESDASSQVENTGGTKMKNKKISSVMGKTYQGAVSKDDKATLEDDEPVPSQLSSSGSSQRKTVPVLHQKTASALNSDKVQLKKRSASSFARGLKVLDDYEGDSVISNEQVNALEAHSDDDAGSSSADADSNAEGQQDGEGNIEEAEQDAVVGQGVEEAQQGAEDLANVYDDEGDEANEDVDN